MSSKDRTRSPPKANQWQMKKVKTRVWVEVGKGLDGWASRTAVGILCVVVAKWSGHLVRQAVYPWPLLAQLSPDTRKETLMSFFKKPGKPPSPVGGTSDDNIPEDLRKRAPTLGHYLCDAAWPDGELRQTSSLVIFVEDGKYKACLGEKDTGLSLWASANSFDDMLEAMESRLTDDVVDWRKSRTRGKRS